MEKREPSCTVGNVNWCSHYGKHGVWRYLKKLEVELPYSPEIPFLGTFQPPPPTNTNLKRHVFPYVHCSIIRNSQDTEITYVSINI